MSGKTLIITTLLTLLFAKSESQSFSLQSSAGLSLNNGDTVVVSGNINDFMLDDYLVFSNNSSGTKTLQVLRQELLMLAGTESAFAFGLLMYNPAINQSIDPVILSANSVDSAFVGYYFSNNIPGTSYVSYAFFDENNPSDSTWMVFQYNMTSATGITDNAFAESPLVFPNPSSGIYHIHKSFQITSETTAAVYNGDGRCVLVPETSELQNQLQFNLSKLPDGYYYLKFDNVEGGWSKVFTLIKN
jgi:Secretion system C-terminal sorting domain